MANWIKECFAPGMASFGANAYMTGNYKKASERIQKSLVWLPEMNESELYIGMLAVSLSKLGRRDEAAPYLEKAQQKFDAKSESEKSEFEIKLIAEISNEIHQNT